MNSCITNLRWVGPGLLVLLLAAPAVPACKQATTEVGRTVCRLDDLRDADRRLTEA